MFPLVMPMVTRYRRLENLLILYVCHTVYCNKVRQLFLTIVCSIIGVLLLINLLTPLPGAIDAVCKEQANNHILQPGSDPLSLPGRLGTLMLRSTELVEFATAYLWSCPSFPGGT